MICEEQLVQQALSGNQEAFRQLVEKYKAYVFAIVLNFVPDHFEAENVAQDVFLQIYRSLPQYHFNSFKSWIGRIAANKALDWQRTQKRNGCEQPFNLESLLNKNLISPVNNPEAILLLKEDTKRIMRICSELPEIYRNAVEKFYFQGKSRLQIAEEEHTTIKTIESRLYRGRKMLSEKWEGKTDGLL